MPGVVPFTNNYSDMSTREGYQYRFNCMRCGNGYDSKFRHSVTGFGGRFATLAGSLMGGEAGGRLEQLGYNAEWLKDTTRGSTNDKRLAEAVDDVKEYFVQCHRCGQWVCKDVCWNNDRGLCVTCAPKLDQEIAGMQAEAQRQQLEDKIRQQDFISQINVVDERAGLCPSCGGETGGGKFCQGCGTALAAAPAQTKKFCTNCGTQLGTGAFCAECGTPAG